MKPRLLHVITRLCVGGAQLTLLESSKELREEFDIHITFGPDVGEEGSLEDEAMSAFPTYPMSVLRRDISPREDGAAIRALRRLYRELRPDIVHTHSSKAGILGRTAGVAQPVRIVHSIHGWGHTPADSASKRRLLVLAERICAPRAQLLIAVSADVRDEGLQLGIGREDQYRLAPEYVDYAPTNPDPNAARREAREALGLRADLEVVGWVGRFVEQKDPKTLLGVTRRLLEHRPSVHVVFIGDGPRRMEVERGLRATGLAPRCTFAGFRDDVRRLYAAFDVLLHTSRWEGQPRVVQESIAERVPVVTARVAGTGDLMRSGQVGAEVAPGAVTSFVSALEAILDDPRRRAPLPSQAIDEVARRHGRPASLRAHRDIYAELMSRSFARSDLTLS